jgi:tellurite resistance protein
MSEDSISIRGRSEEEQYFLKAEGELLEKVRARAAKEDERKALGHFHGVEDPDILAAFDEAGYDRDSVQVIHLVPLIQIAWADGSVSKEERAELLAIAAARDVVEGSAAHAKLLSWLDSPPSALFFSRTMHIITRLVEVFPEAKRQALHGDVMNTALAVASASGGFLGLGSKVSSTEKALLDKFAKAFETAHAAALEKAAQK